MTPNARRPYDREYGVVAIPVGAGFKPARVAIPAARRPPVPPPAGPPSLVIPAREPEPTDQLKTDQLTNSLPVARVAVPAARGPPSPVIPAREPEPTDQLKTDQLTNSLPIDTLQPVLYSFGCRIKSVRPRIAVRSRKRTSECTL